MLPDVLQTGLKVVFCGTAAGDRSAAEGQYYAGPGNRFWEVLATTGLTPHRLTPAEYSRLPEFGIGLTDIAKGQSGNDPKIVFRPADREILKEKIERFRPEFLCFNGKRAAREYFARGIDYGLQEELVGTTQLFVAPSTSGAARAFWDVELWQQLAQMVNDAVPSHHGAFRPPVGVDRQVERNQRGTSSGS